MENYQIISDVIFFGLMGLFVCYALFWSADARWARELAKINEITMDHEKKMFLAKNSDYRQLETLRASIKKLERLRVKLTAAHRRFFLELWGIEYKIIGMRYEGKHGSTKTHLQDSITFLFNCYDSKKINKSGGEKVTETTT